MRRFRILRGMSRGILRIVIIAVSALIAAVLIMDLSIVFYSSEHILSPDASVPEADCILVLGAGVYDDGSPSPMLADRLEIAAWLYKRGVSERIIVSGDHGREDYDEVGVMKKYLVDAGVPAEAVFMDHAGFSTYESMYRAKEIFLAESIVAISQRYHLYRAVYDAHRLGLEACGVSADSRWYPGQFYRNVREILARCKDFLFCIFKPHPTFLGEAVPIWGVAE